jgi:heme-degrading monooxygenase HmoA
MRPLVVRIWRTGLDTSRAPEYEDFALSTSLPMFRRHDGFLGVLFAGTGAERAVITLWSDRAAVAALDASPDYRATVRAIEAAGFLRPPQLVEVLDVHGSWTEALGDQRS